MLVPLDGSKLAEEIIPYVEEVAGKLDLDLDLVHVSNPLESEGLSLSSMSQFYVDKMAELVREQVHKVQTNTADKDAIRPVEVRGKVIEGFPAETILKYTAENPIDIIFMGTHGASSVKVWAIGSVAYQVLHAARVPVLIVRSGMPQDMPYDKWPEQTILVPLDGSKRAESALPHAEALARQRGAKDVKILLLNVYAPKITSPDVEYPDYVSSALRSFFPMDDPPARPSHYRELVESEIEGAKDRSEIYLHNIASRFSSQGIAVQTESIMGESAEEIIKYASQRPFRLIVMATHGRSGIKHLAFGDTAEKVLLESNVPVLFIKPESKHK